MNRIVVIGSCNMDIVVLADKRPTAGETIMGNELHIAHGGKGANQAVASSRAKNETIFVGRVGDDDNGRFMLEQFKDNGVNVEHVTVTPNEQTGQAYILLQESGQNSIIIQHGANFDVTAADVRNAKSQIEDSDFVIAQFETPLEATIEAFKIARAAGKTTILNPAPARTDIPKELLELTDLITPNETEAESITGIKVDSEESMKKSSELFHKMGIKGVIITIGERGSYVSYEDIEEIIPAFKVKAVDTTAAGDTFLGALSSELKPDLSNLKESVVYASKSFPSIPTRDVVEQALKEN